MHVLFSLHSINNPTVFPNKRQHPCVHPKTEQIQIRMFVVWVLVPSRGLNQDLNCKDGGGGSHCLRPCSWIQGHRGIRCGITKVSYARHSVYKQAYEYKVQI